MITALQLIFSPFETWEKISTAQRGFLWICCMYLLPLLIIALGLEGFLLTRLGAKRELDSLIEVPVDLAIRYTAAYFVLLVIGVLVSAQFLSLASESFNVRTRFAQSFTVMAYSFGPIILSRILGGLPQINTWVSWLIGVAVAIAVLYHGVGMVLRPEQTKGFGLYLISMIIVLLVSGLIHFAALSVLHGKILQPRAAQTRATSLVGTVAAVAR
jgi:hypothetical protein